MSERIRKAKRRYKIEFGAAMALYIAVLVGAKIASHHVEGEPALTLLALAPVAPIILAVIAFFRFFFSMDERQRRISADAAALTLPIGILTALTLGFLSAFDVFHFESEMVWFAAFLIGTWGVIRLIIGGGRDC